MERDLIQQIHELTKLSFENNEDAQSALEQFALEAGFQPTRTESIPRAETRTVNVRAENQTTPAHPEHFRSESIPVVEFVHKARVNPSYQEGALSPILREKPKS